MNGLSIIIPTYNREQYIEKAIKSILDQKIDRELEIIVSDDGSTDNTVKLANSFGEIVKVVLKPPKCTSQGASGARNRGILAASQGYICFLDSDDYYLKNHLQSIITALEASPNAGFAFCRTLETYKENDPKLFRKWTRENITEIDIINPVVSGNNVVNTNAFIFKKDVFDAVGMFNEAYVGGEDGDMWMRISEQFRGAFSNHYGVVICRHNDNHLSNYKKTIVLKCHLEIYKAAIKRFHALKLNDKYRLNKLRFLVLKYKYSYFQCFGFIHTIYYRYKQKKPLKSTDWYELNYFIGE